MTTRGRPPSLASSDLSEDVCGQRNKSANERVVNIGLRDKGGDLLEYTDSSPATSPLSSPQQKQQQPQQTGRAISDAAKDCTAMDEDDAVPPPQQEQQTGPAISDAAKDSTAMDAVDESAETWPAGHPQQVQDQLEAEKERRTQRLPPGCQPQTKRGYAHQHPPKTSGGTGSATCQPGPSGSTVLLPPAHHAHATQHLTLDDSLCCPPTSPTARKRLTVPLTFLRVQLACEAQRVSAFPRGSHPPVLSLLPSRQQFDSTLVK